MSQLSAGELTRRLALATEAVRAASPVHLRFPTHLRRNVAAIPSAGRTRIATLPTEQESISKVLHSAMPDESIVAGTENHAEAELRKLLRRCWLVSSLDDSMQTHDAFPIVGPSATYVVDGVPLVTAIHLPQLDETITAAKGLGAQIDGRPIRVALPVSGTKAILLGSNGTNVTEVIRRLAGWQLPEPDCGPLSQMCYLATGRIDGFGATFDEPKPWDLAAGGLLVEEAGGAVETRDLLTLCIRAAAAHSLLDHL